jgi:large subunit ribosomal protein L21
MLSQRFCFSTQARLKYAVVDHAHAYESAMKGRHGDQLLLAQIEGLGKDDPPFDPFIEEELAAAAAAAEQDEVEVEEGDEGEEDEYDVEKDSEAEIDLVRYNTDGSLRWKKSELAAFRAGAPAGGFFAIIELAGTQHKITVDDVIVSAKLNPVTTYSVGSVHTFKDVLLVGSSHLTLVGLPFVGGAEVDVMVEEITKDAKVIVFKKRRRKNSRRKKGHRRDVTMLRVLDIRMPSEYTDHTHVARKEITMDV